MLQEQMDMNANAINIMGMGSWRLKPVAAGPIQMLVANIEGGWRHLIDDLRLYSPMPRVLLKNPFSRLCGRVWSAVCAHSYNATLDAHAAACVSTLILSKTSQKLVNISTRTPGWCYQILQSLRQQR